MKVLLADDHDVVRKGLRFILERQPHISVVGEANDGREVLRLVEELRPDVVIMDVAMPQLNGIDATALLAKNFPRVHVIILSMHRDETYVLKALTAGARGYLLKDSVEDDVVPALRAVATGRPFLSPGVTQPVLDGFLQHARQGGVSDSYEQLSHREREVLQLLAEGKSNKEVATTLNIGVATVETHRAHIMQKLGLHNTAELVLYAARRRIVW